MHGVVQVPIELRRRAAPLSARILAGLLLVKRVERHLNTCSTPRT